MYNNDVLDARLIPYIMQFNKHMHWRDVMSLRLVSRAFARHLTKKVVIKHKSAQVGLQVYQPAEFCAFDQIKIMPDSRRDASMQLFGIQAYDKSLYVELPWTSGVRTYETFAYNNHGRLSLWFDNGSVEGSETLAFIRNAESTVFEHLQKIARSFGNGAPVWISSIKEDKFVNLRYASHTLINVNGKRHHSNTFFESLIDDKSVEYKFLVQMEKVWYHRHRRTMSCMFVIQSVRTRKAAPRLDDASSKCMLMSRRTR